LFMKIGNSCKITINSLESCDKSNEKINKDK